jgi:phage tail sheath protein FI
MKYFRNTQTDLIHAFEQDGSQDSLITEDFIQLTEEETDPLVFPLNTAVLVTDVQRSIEKAGSTGTLARSLQAIADQTNALVVVVRVEAKVTEAEQNTAVIGGQVNGKYTGMKALTAEQNLKVKPRILGAPGLDTAPVTAAWWNR